MTEEIVDKTIYDTRRKRLASAFRDKFSEQFESQDTKDKELFVIKVSDFDDFVIEYKFTSYDELPEKGTGDWTKFRQESNAARYELNTASEIGIHGEPPYRIDNEGRTLYVRMLTNMVRLTHTMIALKVESLLRNKKVGYEKMIDFLRENQDKLTPEIQAMIGQQQALFELTISHATHSLSSYVKQVNKTYESAMMALENKKAIDK